MKRLALLDLNLLVAFVSILEHRSVTKAARALGLTQPAVSHKLRRLREELGDPLFVSDRRELVPTDRARAMAEPLRRLLGELEQTVLGAETFDPSSARRRFTIASADLFEFTSLPGILEDLSGQAPHIELLMRPPSRDVASGMARGALDLVFVPTVPEAAAIRRVALFDEDFVVMGRPGHPLLQGRLTLGKYLSAHHLLISPTGLPRGFVEDALARLGKQRHVALQLPHFATAPFVAARTDLLLTAPRSLARTAGDYVELTIKKVPIELPRVRVFMAWHERLDQDAGHRWFRNSIRRFVAGDPLLNELRASEPPREERGRRGRDREDPR
ncbi:MAG: LysR family transcriptional regulator [Myxococcota bacterium]